MGSSAGASKGSLLSALQNKFKEISLALSLRARWQWLVTSLDRKEKIFSKHDMAWVVSTPKDPVGFKRFYPALEILVIIIWALWVGRSYLVPDPNLALGSGNDDYLISVYPYFPLTRLLNCGDCVLWNGLLNGGSPTFGNSIGALLHPVMAPIILVFEVLTGSRSACWQP